MLKQLTRLSQPARRSPMAVVAIATMFAASGAAAADADSAHTLTVKQESGKIVYWVLPGPRKLDPAVFGTPQEPSMLLKPKIKAAKQGPYPPNVPGLLKDLPFLVGLPMKARAEAPDGGWVLKKPNPFSDKARIVSGDFSASFEDHVAKDQLGPPGKTPDSAEMTAQFTDPAGNDYRVELDHVVQPPLPGYNTQGGVMIDSTHHGTTGTGTPLMPEVDTHAAFWGIGKIFVNGEPRGMRVTHLMTTEVVRDSEYRLVFQDDLPLGPDKRQIADQAHHTHLMVLPVKPVPGKGPTFEPVKTAFELPNGKNQPFMHIMFEQDEIVE